MAGHFTIDTGWTGQLRERIRPYYLRHVYYRLQPESRPAEFQRCWQAPVEWLGDPPDLDIPAQQPGRADVVILPMTDWHHRWQRSQYLALELAALGRRCFLLNPHLGRQYRQTPARARRPALGRLGERIYEIHAPLPREPVFHHRLLSEEESAALARAIGAALDRAGSRDVAFLLALPVWAGAAGILRKQRGGPLIYDCHDWIAGFSNMAAEIVDAEPAAMRASDAVLFSAGRLQEEFGRLVPDTRRTGILLRNGVPEWPEPVAGRTRAMVAGYVGAIEDWFWSDAVEAAARRLPSARFVLAGAASEAARKRLSSCPNIEFLGEVSAADVPGLLATFRAGLLPHQGRLVHYVDPLKVYEYFHFGLPVASTDMAEAARHGALVYTARTAEQFASAVQQAMEEDDPRLDSLRKETARQSTWRRRAVELDKILEHAKAG